jgi:hypothetical protein
VVQDIPILMDKREKPIHFIRNIFEMRRLMIAYIDRLLPVTSPELSDICHCRSVEGP